MKEQIAAWKDEITAWRRDIHKHPELAFEEHRTADFVAQKLESFGLDVHRGLAGTAKVLYLHRQRRHGGYLHGAQCGIRLQ
jgi:hippurate hydrolase